MFLSLEEGVFHGDLKVVATLRIDKVALAESGELVPWESAADVLSAGRNN